MKEEKIDNMIQSAVRLPQSLHQRLKKAGGERGMGEEIRRRLEASFDAEAKAPRDPKTRKLLEAISFLAGLTTAYFGSWSEDAVAFQVLKGSVDIVFRHYQPEGDPVHAKPNLTGMGEFIFGKTGENENRSTEEISRTLARFWFMSKEIVEGKKG